jgi:hypothetical protein
MGTRNNWRRRTAKLGFEPLESRHLMAVVINEFLAANSSGIQDQDGDRSDWIELHNTDAAPVNLAGWHLTDDAGDLDKWTFPAVSIPANGYLLVYASGKDRAVAGQELHANFSLEQDGEYLALVLPDGGTIADAFNPFPAQVDDVSYGRGGQVPITENLIGEQGSVKALVPNASTSTSWFTTSFNDSTWTAGVGGVGFDNVPDYLPYIGLNVGSQMLNVRASIYLRYAFQVTSPADISSLLLRIRYDDGFAIYLNGTLIPAPTGQRNAPASLTFSSAATTSHPDAQAVVYEAIPLDAYRNLLVAGNNVLAIHGMNTTAANNDFLISPLLAATRPSTPVTGYMATPSPGAANLEGTLGVVADTSFSVDRGFFTSPFTVQIASPTTDAVIRYTTDGSPPTATTGLVFNPANPPLITTTTTLRAAAFKTGWTPTNVDTQTYIFLDDVIQQDGVGLPPTAAWGYAGPDWAMDPDVVNHPTYAGTIKDDLKAVPTVSLVMPWDDWFAGGGVGIYPTEAEIERAVSMEYFTGDGGQAFQIDGGIEIQGGTSDDRWKMDKLSMRVKFKEPYGPEKLDADLFNAGDRDDGAAVSFNTLVFDAHLGYTWAYGGGTNPVDQRSRAMFVQDGYVSDLQNLAGGAAPHTSWVHLYVNGLYWGMYEMHERADEHFAESYYGGADEDYDVLKHNATNVVSADPNNPNSAIDNYAALLNLVRQSMTVPANYEAVAAKLDVDDFITYMVVNYYVGNDDWAHQNWVASFNRVDPAGRWRYHSWDAENVLKNVDRDSTTLNNAGGPTEVFQRLIVNPEFRLRFNDVVNRLMANGGLLSPTGAAEVYLDRMAEIDRAIVGESARWGDNHTTASDPTGAGNPYLRTHWVDRSNDLLWNYFPNRTTIVQGQFTTRGWNMALGAATFSQFGGEVSPGYALTIAKPGGSPAGSSIYYTLDGSDPRDPATNLPRAGALLYTGVPITINAATRVQARIYFDLAGSLVNEWSPLTDATFVLDTPFPLRITELHYNPAPYPGVGAQELEFIELLNTGTQSISLDGVQIADFASEPYSFPNGITLAAGERIILANTPASFIAAYGNGYNLVPTGYASANLSNGGESIRLVGPVGEDLQEFAFSDSGGWPTSADGGGKSLEIIDPLGDAASPSNWRASFSTGGSPGAAGGAPATPGDFDADGDADGADFLTWQRNLGKPALQAGRAHGDADGDRDVDAADLALWSGDFGATPAIAAAATAAAPATSSVISTAPAELFAADEWIMPPAATSREHGRQPVREAAVDAALNGAAVEHIRTGWRPSRGERSDRRGAFVASDASSVDAESLDAAHDGNSQTGLDGALAAPWRLLRR